MRLRIDRHEVSLEKKQKAEIWKVETGNAKTESKN
jgi:hypothetical protein